MQYKLIIFITLNHCTMSYRTVVLRRLDTLHEDFSTIVQNGTIAIACLYEMRPSFNYSEEFSRLCFEQYKDMDNNHVPLIRPFDSSLRILKNMFEEASQSVVRNKKNTRTLFGLVSNNLFFYSLLAICQ